MKYNNSIQNLYSAIEDCSKAKYRLDLARVAPSPRNLQLTTQAASAAE